MVRVLSLLLPGAAAFMAPAPAPAPLTRQFLFGGKKEGGGGGALGNARSRAELDFTRRVPPALDAYTARHRRAGTPSTRTLTPPRPRRSPA